GRATLHHPFGVAPPARLDRGGAPPRRPVEPYEPYRPPGCQRRAGIVSERKQRAIALQPVRLPQPAHHEVAGSEAHQTWAALNTPACLRSDCTVSDGVAPCAIHLRAFSASTWTFSAAVVPFGL